MMDRRRLIKLWRLLLEEDGFGVGFVLIDPSLFECVVCGCYSYNLRTLSLNILLVW